MAKIGDKVTDDDYQFTVTKIKCGVSRVGDQYSGEKAQGQFCLVSMRVKNVGNEAINFSDENQALVDTKGKKYSPDDAAWIYLDDGPVRRDQSGQHPKDRRAVRHAQESQAGLPAAEGWHVGIQRRRTSEAVKPVI